MTQDVNKSSLTEIPVEILDGSRADSQESDSQVEAADNAGTAEQIEGKNYLEQLQRLQAEFSNYKKRVAKERLEYVELAKHEMISALLPVLDDFDRLTQNSNHENDDSISDGIILIRDKLLDILFKEGLKPIESVGKDFDPNIHEAIATTMVADTPTEKIVEEWQKGYFFKQKLLRPAKVKVAVKATTSEGVE